ncbi:DNA topoisomerase IB [Mycobacterium sp. 3519A]|uniref:DNA topoisomerase IB n=1 Tax=Mycobacterium sp. 3519A TaxID=2057184 RepID=UPI000C7ABBED|nr:DNA topoisomerase IB [Mycobacterium sp. 3519A]
MKLRRSSVSGPGIRRVRRGKGFSYQDHDGAPVTDQATLERIQALVIPPAWKNVWICPHPNGHIQAVGTDAAGRRQYLYHQQWHEERNEEKFDRVLEMSAALPEMRRQITADLRARGLERDRVLALALLLLDLGYFRAGGEQYAEENNSYGIATLLCEHVALQKHAVEFDYPAKSGVRRTLLIEDDEVARSARALLRGRRESDRFLVCRNGSGWVDLHADDLNARFKELVGEDYTVKDLRTWHGTVLGAAAFVDADPPANKTVIKRVESAVMKEVAEELGNTPAVARSSYVDPRVVQGYEAGLTIAAGVRRANRSKKPAERQAILESSTARLIRKVAKG